MSVYGPRRWAANCSLLFTELPLLQRPAAAAAAGFDAIEFWWPFATPRPGAAEVAAFKRAIIDAGVRLVGLNFYAGDLAGPDAGVVSTPGRERDFLDSVEVAVAIGGRLGVVGFNALYGNRVPEATPDEQDALATRQLVAAARAAAQIGANLLLEPVSGPKPCPLRTAADAMAVVRRVRAAGPTNVGLLADLYHLSVNGDDLDATIERWASDILHVQIADAPGRHEPGSGGVELASSLAHIDRTGYAGWIALEYVPSGATDTSLDWLARDARSEFTSTRESA